MKKTFTIIKIGQVKMPDGRVRGRFGGVYAAARGLKVCPQTLYDYLNGRDTALGPSKRERLVIR